MSEAGNVVCRISDEDQSEYKHFLADVEVFKEKNGINEPATMAGEFENALMLGTAFEGRRHHLWHELSHKYGFDFYTCDRLTLDIDSWEISTRTG